MDFHRSFEASKMAGSLLEDIFFVKDIDPGGKKFDRGIDMKPIS